MINFHLQFPIPELKNKINYTQKIIFIGSCFAQNIGNLFTQYKFNTLINTHGIQYNPWSIANALTKCMLNESLSKDELFFANESWNSWEHHSRFSNVKKSECLHQINAEINTGYNYLNSADWLIITLGSSFVYQHLQTNRLVANCHKISQKQFSKQLLSTTKTVLLFEELINQLKEKNKDLKIVFTISPVRYIRDGVVENNLSKARLIDAVHTLVNRYSHCFYFPAYELIMDDLRDYRFFKDDLVHPTEQAIQYVFDKFIDASVDKESKILLEKIKEINAAKNHRPTDANLESYQLFKSVFLEKCYQLKKENPSIELDNEINFFGSGN